MSDRQYIIRIPDSACRVVVVDAQGPKFSEFGWEPHTTPAEKASGIALKLRELKYRGEPVLIALSSRACLAAPISLSGLSPRDRAAMTFRLEEQLPVAAEEFVCDFVVDQERALGIATMIDPLKPLIEALQREGIAVASVSPWALLAAGAGEGDRIAVVENFVEDEESQNVVEIRNGRLRNWLVTDDLDRSLQLLALQGGELPGPPTRISQSETDRLASAEAARVLTGTKRPWIELRRDALAPADRLSGLRGAINSLLAAAAVCLLAVGAAAMIRATRYARVADSHQAAIAADFHALYPDWQDANIPAVLESEHRKLSATASAKLPAELRGSALRTLHDVLASLPAKKGFTIDRMMFDDVSFEMEGKAGALADVDALADAARRSGLAVQPPQSRREDSGQWSFTIRGSKLPATASLPSEGR